MGHRVLVVEDDPTVREVTRRYLTAAGYAVDEAVDGPSGLASAREHRPDVVVLDVMLPGLSGWEVCRVLREMSPPLPVVMLSALGEEDHRIAGLQLGADDYLSKPFSPRELVLRIGSVLRRSGPAVGAAAATLVDGDLALDPAARSARRGGDPLPLTTREFDLLAYMIGHPGRAFTRAELLADVWGWEFGDESTVTVHVRRLREKIEPDPTHPRRIATVWGTGYRYDAGRRVIDELVGAAPLALLFCVPIAGLGALVVLWLRRRSLAATMVGLVLVPLLAALAGVLAVSGFMYTPQLAGIVAVCIVVAAVTVPAGLLLGRAVGREAMWLSEVREAERRSEESRRRLVADMSHDLRSPLAGIRGMTDAVLDGVVCDPAEVHDYLARVRRETVRMAAMVDDLFQVSRATSGTLQLALGPVALAEAASDAVGAVAAAARTASVQVRADDPEAWPTVLGSDPDLTRVLRNVLANAVRHTPEGGVVRLSAGVAAGVARLTVDDGCGGIPDEDLPRVFEIGYRGPPRGPPSEHGGAGLGLSIAQGLMQAQSGDITITNHGPGCRVELTLALAKKG